MLERTIKDANGHFVRLGTKVGGKMLEKEQGDGGQNSMKFCNTAKLTPSIIGNRF